MNEYESRQDSAQRLTLLTRLFLALDIEAEGERLAAWADATQGINVAQLELRCRKLAREWGKGTPKPSDLLAAVEGRSTSGMGRTKPSMWVDGVHRLTGERVVTEDERAAQYRALGTPFIWDQSDEANAIRAKRELPKPEPEAPF